MARLARAARKVGFPDAAALVRAAHGAPELLTLVLEQLTVHESTFLRHAGQWDQVARRVLSRVAPGARGRVWCAGCAHGQEPYTLAFLAYIERVLDRCEGNRSAAARILGIHPATLSRKLPS